MIGRKISAKYRNAVLTGLAVCGALAAGTVLYPAIVSAADPCTPYGRICKTGFFSGLHLTDPDDLFLLGYEADDIGEFLKEAVDNLECSSTGRADSRLLDQTDRKSTSMAFIVLTMLGVKADTASKDQACVRFPEWRDRVTQYDNANLVRYNELRSSEGLSAFYSDEPVEDVALAVYNVTAVSIVFYAQDGSGALYSIRRSAGSPIGELGALTPITQPPANPSPNPPSPSPGPPGPSPSPSPSPAPSPSPPPVQADANTTSPYFIVRGGDVSAGPGMSIGGTDCAVPAVPEGGAVGWNRGGAGSFGGAGTQYAAFVLNHLQDFATAQGSAAAPTGLAFANTAAGLIDQNRGLFGGKFAGGNCVPDYYAGATPPNTHTGERLLSSLPGFPAGGAIPNGSTLTYYVDGDLYIDSNVRFSGNYPGLASIPSFSLVVRGNILIDRNVTQLDGIYIAQPSNNPVAKGIIFTCATDSVPPFLPIGLNRNLHDTCNTVLTVNGALSARQVWLLRSFGDLAGDPAERINYTPEIWLTIRSGTGGLERAGYDAITSLPPVL